MRKIQRMLNATATIFHIQMSIVVFFAAIFFITPFAMAEEKKKEEVLKLEEVVVTATPIKPETDGTFIPLGSHQQKVDTTDRVQSSDTAELLRDMPGVSLRLNGGVATIPGLRGLDDDRVKVIINGMSITSACSNHMNPPLSYVTSGNISNISLMAGITPVSLGGDSIGGTISVESELPKFAGPGE